MSVIIGVLVVVVLFALVEYLANIYHISGRSINRTEYSKPTTKSVVEKEKIPNCLTCRMCGEEYKARFENGIVYALPKYTEEYEIGYYVLEDGQWKVRCISDKGEIGKIMPSNTSALIYFNRLGDLERQRNILKKISETSPWLTEEEQNRQYNQVAKKTKLTWLCAEVFEGFIQDVDTFDTIAISTSKDLVGAAAAFICLQYECVMDGKYHAFYSPIN